MALLSPGVEIVEIDASTIAPTVSNSIAVFAGNFDKGPVGEYLLISSESELVSFYGEPTIQNYSDWMQVSSFLKYGNLIYVARAANTNGSTEEISGAALTANVSTEIVPVNDVSLFKVGDLITFADAEGVFDSVYKILSIDGTLSELTLNEPAVVDFTVSSKIYSVSKSMNSVFEITTGTPVSDYLKTAVAVGSYNEFENIESSIAMSSEDTKVKFIAKNPGNWGNDIEIAVALASDFGLDKYVFEGIALDALYEYFPTGDEVAIVTRLKGNIQDVFTVSFDPKAKDNNNKSMYIEDVVNQQSQLIFVKDNTANDLQIPSQIFSTAGAIQLVQGFDSPMGEDDLIAAYEMWENKEEVDYRGPLAA